MEVGDAIKQIRKQIGLSQKDFATKCGITQTYLSQIENKRKIPNFKIIEGISNKTKIPIPVIMFLSIEPHDVRENKKELYNILKPSIHSFINQIFINKK